MSNTTAQPSIVVSGQVSLTHALAQAVEDGILPNLDPVSVIPLLTNSLEWRVQKLNNDVVDTNKLVNGKGHGCLKIGVSSRKVVPRVRDDAFPIYGEWVSWPRVTANKCGGAA
jgi:hypothetical protein